MSALAVGAQADVSGTAAMASDLDFDGVVTLSLVTLDGRHEFRSRKIQIDAPAVAPTPAAVA